MNKGISHTKKKKVIEINCYIIYNGEEEKMQERGICTLFAMKTNFKYLSFQKEKKESNLMQDIWRA